MGFSKLFKPASVPTTSVEPPTVSDTQEQDARSDYEQKASRRRGLLATILSDSNRSKTPAAPGNSTLG